MKLYATLRTFFSLLLDVDHVENLPEGNIKTLMVVIGGVRTMSDVFLHSSLSVF